MTGATSSFTLTLNMHVDELPAASVMVYVTNVDPTGKKSPGVWLDVIVGEVEQLSVAIGGFQETLAPQDKLFMGTEMSEGQLLMAGGVLSTTITLNMQVVLLPESSVAV